MHRRQHKAKLIIMTIIMGTIIRTITATRMIINTMNIAATITAMAIGINSVRMPYCDSLGCRADSPA